MNNPPSMLSRYGTFVFEAAIKARELIRCTIMAAKAMMANSVQPPSAMTAKMKSLKRIGKSRFSVSVVVSECVREAYRTGEDNQGAVVGQVKKGQVLVLVYIYICDGEE